MALKSGVGMLFRSGYLGCCIKWSLALKGSLKRFEDLHEISLKHLLMLAVVLDATEEFDSLFSKRQHESMDEALPF